MTTPALFGSPSQVTLAVPQIAPDLTLDDVVLDWVSLSADLDVRGAVVDAQLERTMSGASTFTLELLDPRGDIFRGARLWTPQPRKSANGRKSRPVYDTAGEVVRGPQARGLTVECEVDGIAFRLVKVAKSGDRLTLTFEDRIVSWLRGKKGTKRSASRSDVTRAQFLLALLREIKAERVTFVCPELTKRQPIGTASTGTAEGVTGGSPGGFAKANLFGQDGDGKRYPLRSGQLALAAQALRVADQLKAPLRARLALLMALSIESKFQNLTYGDASSVGPLQLLAMHGPVERRRNVEYVVRRFLAGPGFAVQPGAIALAKAHPDWSPGKIAQTIQGSAHGERYDRARQMADAMAAAWGGDGVNVPEADAAAAGSRKGAQTYRYERAADEDSWTAMQRLAEEVGWRLFVRGRALVFMSEPDLYRQPVRMRLEHDDAAVLSLDFDVDWGKPVSAVTANVVMRRWDAPPGTCVELGNWGVLDGRWLVESVSRSLFDPVAQVSLRQPSRELLEPAAESSSTTAVGSTGTNEQLSGAKAKAMKVYERAREIDAQNFPYVWGGGHGTNGRPSRGTGRDPGTGYDCSGYTGACLLAAGVGRDAHSSEFGRLPGMEPGPGKYVTVLYNGTHVWIRFEPALGVTAKRADTSPHGSGPSGPHLRNNERPTTGFQTCHPRGL